jgi:hypothetical protein
MDHRSLLNIFLLINLLSGYAIAQNDSIPHINISINFKLGINTIYSAGNSDFEGGYTGWGIFLEPQLSERASFLISYNFTRIRTKSTKNSMIEFDELETREVFMLIRYRIGMQKVSLFPEVGIGTWKHDTGYFLVGTGTEFNGFKSFYLTMAFDYSYNGYRWLDVGGGGWTSGFFKFTVYLSYSFHLKLKGKPVPENPH